MSRRQIGVDADGWPVYDDADGDLIALINRAQAQSDRMFRQSQRELLELQGPIRRVDADGWPVIIPRY